MTRSPAETEQAGAALAQALAPGDVVLLSGDLGSGKTTFVRGALRALGVAGPIASPTFVLGARYDGAAGPVAHLDLYRLAGIGTEDPGLLDPFFGADTIAFIEWPEHAGEPIAGLLPPGARVARRVELAHAGGDSRDIRVLEP